MWVVPILVRIGGMGLEEEMKVLSVLVKCEEGREEMGRICGCLRVFITFLLKLIDYVSNF